MLSKRNLLGVGITSASKQEVLEYITRSLEKKEEKYYIVTPNPEFLVFANKHSEFKSILNHARLAIPDGFGVIWAGKVLGAAFKERATGTDLMEKLCEKVSEKPITVGFLGGRDKVAERTAERLKSKFPGLKVVFAGEEWPFRKTEDGSEGDSLQSKVSPSPDILFVAFGFPKQEEWIAENIGKIPVRIAIGVGGAFDYVSGRVPRAPIWVQNLGFEWLYRLIREPWRIKRQLALIEFIFLVLKEKLSSRK